MVSLLNILGEHLEFSTLVECIPALCVLWEQFSSQLLPIFVWFCRDFPSICTWWYLAEPQGYPYTAFWVSFLLSSLFSRTAPQLTAASVSLNSSLSSQLNQRTVPSYFLVWNVWPGRMPGWPVVSPHWLPFPGVMVSAVFIVWK